MIASLPMYWLEENAAAWKRFWHVVQIGAAREGITLPPLTPPEALPADWTEHWLSPDLVLSMTCGLPFRTVLRDRVTYVGTLDFGLTAPLGYYCSEIVTRATADGAPDTASLTAPRLAYNSADSQSGWAAASDFRATATDFLETGYHAASVAAVAAGEADVALIDAVTWRLLRQRGDACNGVTSAGRTRPTPGLPLIAAKGTDPEPLYAALQYGLERLDEADRERLGGPTALAVLREDTYFAVPIPAPPPV